MPDVPHRVAAVVARDVRLVGVVRLVRVEARTPSEEAGAEVRTFHMGAIVTDSPRTVGDVIGEFGRHLARWQAVGVDNEPASISCSDLRLLIDAARKTLPPPPPETATAPVVAPTDAGYAPLATQAERLGVREGDTVAVEMDDGSVRAFVVRHPPWQMCGGEWVVAIGRIPGGYLLERVRAKKTTATEHGGS